MSLMDDLLKEIKFGADIEMPTAFASRWYMLIIPSNSVYLLTRTKQTL
jgi:hypothetical protein